MKPGFPVLLGAAFHSQPILLNIRGTPSSGNLADHPHFLATCSPVQYPLQNSHQRQHSEASPRSQISDVTAMGIKCTRLRTKCRCYGVFHNTTIKISPFNRIWNARNYRKPCILLSSGCHIGRNLNMPPRALPLS